MGMVCGCERQVLGSQRTYWRPILKDPLLSLDMLKLRERSDERSPSYTRSYVARRPAS